MALFNKKNCDVCGQKIGLLGNRKLEDGNLCKDCAKKLSPWFTGRRHSTLNEIKKQLDAREQNRSKVSAFRKSMELGMGYNKLYVDQGSQNFAVCASSDFDSKNPDIIPISCVTAVKTRRDEHRTERKYEDSEGNMVSYNPPQYDFSYDFHCEIEVEHPYIDEIEFKINDSALKQGQGVFINEFSRKMSECESICDEIKRALGRGQSAGMGFGGMSNEFNTHIHGGGIAGAAMAGVMNAMANSGMNNSMNSMNNMNSMGNMANMGGMNNMNNMGAMNGGMSGMPGGMESQVQIPMADIPYRSTDEYGDLTVILKAQGSVSYRIIDQNTYSRTLMAGAGNLPDELLMALRIAFTEMEKAGVGAMKLMPQYQNLRSQFISQCMNCAFNVRYGIEIVDAVINFNLAPESAELMKKAMMLQQSNAGMQNNFGAQNMGGQWECPNCGGVNSGKFCQNCGTPRP